LNIIGNNFIDRAVVANVRNIFIPNSAGMAVILAVLA